MYHGDRQRHRERAAAALSRTLHAHRPAVQHRVAIVGHRHGCSEIHEPGHALRAEGSKACRRDRRTDRAERAVRVNDLLHARSAAHAPASLIGHGHSRKQVGARRAAIFGAGGRSGNHLNTGMPMHEKIAFVKILPDTHQRRIHAIGAHSAADHRARPHGNEGQMIAAQRLKLSRLHACRNHRNRVRDDRLGARTDPLRNIGKACRGGEARQLIDAAEQDLADGTNRKIHVRPHLQARVMCR